MASSDTRRWWALGALALSVLVVGLDLTVLNLALPTLAADLHASTSDLQWFVDAYSLVLAAALLPAGLLGDRYGRKKLLTGALVVFGAASLACAYSRSPGELIAARSVLGLAAAVILPLSLAVIPVLFTAAERPRAIATVGGATFLGFPIGPLLGGWLLDHFWWGSVFLINVPVVVIALVAVVLLMPESRSERQLRLDVPGVLLSSGGLTALTYGVIRAGQNGWGNGTAVATMAGGLVLLAAFMLWERRVTGQVNGHPLIDLTLFRSQSFTWGTVLSTMVSFALFGILFGVPQYFRDVRGIDSLGSGLRLLPLIGGLAVGLGHRAAAADPGQDAGRQSAREAAGQREDPGHRRVRGDGRGAGGRRQHERQQRHRLRCGLVCGHRPRPGNRDAHRPERGPRRPVARAQRFGIRADHGDAAGRSHDRGRGPGHRAGLRLPERAQRERAPGRRGRRGPEQRGRRSRRRARGRVAGSCCMP